MFMAQSLRNIVQKEKNLRDSTISMSHSYLQLDKGLYHTHTANLCRRAHEKPVTVVPLQRKLGVGDGRRSSFSSSALFELFLRTHITYVKHNQNVKVKNIK